MAAIRKGIDDIERGDTIPHAEVKKRLAALLTE
jgi:predicted transcriptional regulator